MTARVTLLVLMAIAATRCGSSPTSPTELDATLLHLTVAPQVTSLFIGRPQQFVANGVFSDGHAQSLAATWRSDDPHTATVSGDGLVTPVRPGPATITASFGGHSAALPLKVIQDYAGQWEGNGLVDACQANPPGNCESILRQPQALIALFIDQVDQQIRALVFISGASFRPEVWADGVVSDTGEMTLSGEWRTEVLPQRFVVLRVSDWSSAIGEDGTMSGRTVAWRESNVSNRHETERFEVRFNGLRRVRPGPARREAW
jgi:hypothetical protein